MTDAFLGFQNLLQSEEFLLGKVFSNCKYFIICKDQSQVVLYDMKVVCCFQAFYFCRCIENFYFFKLSHMHKGTFFSVCGIEFSMNLNYIINYYRIIMWQQQTDPSCSDSAEVKNTWSFTSTSLHGVINTG